MGMKNFMVLVLSVSLVVGVTVITSCIGTKTTTKDITPQEAFTLIQKNQNNPDFVIIDVRTPEEFGGEHIEQATNINFYSETFRDTLNALDKNKTYLIYCQVGGRSSSALDIMAELNFKEVYNILGGINQWKAEGLSTVE